LKGQAIIRLKEESIRISEKRLIWTFREMGMGERKINLKIEAHMLLKQGSHAVRFPSNRLF